MKIIPRISIHNEMNIDDPQTTWERRIIIKKKDFLRQIYEEWYAQIIEALPVSEKPVIEVGSGAGFLDEKLPGVVTSDILFCPFIDIILNGKHMPLRSESMSAIILVDVLHHISNPVQFFKEATRCIEPGGKIIMIEPWVSAWSTFIYKYFHHEDFQTHSREWRVETIGPLSSANIAMPWVMFERDKQVFNDLFPQWSLSRIERMMPFVYLLSGGLSDFSFMPSWTYRFWRKVEKYLSPLNRYLSMFAIIELIKSS